MQNDTSYLFAQTMHTSCRQASLKQLHAYSALLILTSQLIVFVLHVLCEFVVFYYNCTILQHIIYMH